jgi:hypothetical protein
MEILFVWVGSIVTSLGLEAAMVKRIIKDIADSGYKIDLTKIRTLHSINSNGYNTECLALVIPFYNILNSYQYVMQYAYNREGFLWALYNMGYLEEMTESEKNIYSKNPTFINAYQLFLYSKEKQKSFSAVITNCNAEESKIFYKVGKSLDNITILRATGIYERYPVETQKQVVIESLKWMIKNGMGDYIKDENLIKEIKSLIEKDEKINLASKQSKIPASYNREFGEEKSEDEGRNLTLMRTLKNNLKK